MWRAGAHVGTPGAGIAAHVRRQATIHRRVAACGGVRPAGCIEVGIREPLAGYDLPGKMRAPTGLSAWASMSHSYWLAGFISLISLCLHVRPIKFGKMFVK